jgi:antirestriction protein ArdC
MRYNETPRADIYSEVTNKIIKDLENGIVPWARPWGSTGGAAGTPRNAATSRPYSGVNVLILWAAAFDGGFSSSRWLTFNQARDCGGMVRKGSKGTAIVYASTFVPEAEKARAVETGDDARHVGFLKRQRSANV